MGGWRQEGDESSWVTCVALYDRGISMTPVPFIKSEMSDERIWENVLSLKKEHHLPFQTVLNKF